MVSLNAIFIVPVYMEIIILHVENFSLACVARLCFFYGMNSMCYIIHIGYSEWPKIEVLYCIVTTYNLK